MKYILISTLTLILGFSITYNLNIEEKRNKKNQTIEVSNIEKKEQKNSNPIIRTRETLPEYIKEDLERFGFNSTKLNEEIWNDFLKSFDKENIKSLSNVTEGQSLIHLAALKGSKELINNLLEAGLDINQKDRFGFSPILYAINKEAKVEFLEFLIEKGAKLEVNKDNRYDPMYIALGASGYMIKGQRDKNHTNEEVVDFLLDNGFEFEKKHLTTLLMSKSEKKDEYLRNFIDSMEVNEIYKERSKRGYLLSFLGRKASNDSISYLLDNKIDFSTYKSKKAVISSAMHPTISNENFKRILTLPDADVNDFGAGGKTALMETVKNGNFERTKILLEHGADLNLKDMDGNDVYNYLEKSTLPKEEKTKIYELFKTYSN